MNDTLSLLYRRIASDQNLLARVLNPATLEARGRGGREARPRNGPGR